MEHWTWVGADGKSNDYECKVMESDYLPSISIEKFLWLGGWWWCSEIIVIALLLLLLN